MPQTAHFYIDQDLKARLFDLIDRFAVSRGEVILASGQKSDFYLDCRQVYFRGEAQFVLGELFFKELIKIETKDKVFDACGGMALGSIPLSCALSAAAFRRGREFPGFTVRKEAKDHGLKSVIEGKKCLFPKSHALMLEDVVTTGTSVINAIITLREHGINVDTLFAIVDREQGGQKNLKEIGVELHSIFKLADFMKV